MKRDQKAVLAIIVVAIVSVSAYFVTTRYLLNLQQIASQPLTCSPQALPYATSQSALNQGARHAIEASPTLPIQVVAGENFWGSLVSQLGGNRTLVTSIVTDPNVDPHDYESNSQNAVAIADANLVIINGAGYDNWAMNLLNANPSSTRTVLNVANLLGKTENDNPHFWYGPGYVNETIRQMYTDLIQIDPTGTNYYTTQYANLNASLTVYNGIVNEIRQRFSGVRIASTESIFQYMAQASGLDLISPYPFMKAVAEGNDPSPGCIAVFQSQLLNPSSPGNATVLVYNEQTVTPVTDQLKSEATQNHISVIAVTETIQPPGARFQDWMYGELHSLRYALNATALGRR